MLTGSLLPSPGVDTLTALTSLTLAFTLSQVLALAYMRTFKGLSYSRGFVMGIALGSIVTCMLMLAIGSSIAAGLGLAGGLSIIRFRTTLRDPRDMVFIFAALGVGMVTGLQAYTVAILGVAVFLVATVVLQTMTYGTRRAYDGLLRFSAPADATGTIITSLARHTRRFALVTLREAAQGERIEHAYQVRVPGPEHKTSLVAALQALESIRDITLHGQDASVEL